MVDGLGHPLVPPAINAELKDIHPRLSLEYSPGLKAFVVKETWPADDPRRELIKSGEINPTSDWRLLCPVPADVGLDDLRGWLARQLRLVARTRPEVAQWVAESEAKIRAEEAALQEAQSAEILEEVFMTSTKSINVGNRRTKVRSIK